MKEKVSNTFSENEKHHRANNVMMKSIKVPFESERFVKRKPN